MTIFKSTGSDVLNSLVDKPKQEEKKQDKIDFKRLYINLKDGESVNVKLLGAADVVEYRAHGDFNLGLYNQTCTQPSIQKCAYCEAQNYAKAHIEEKNMEDWDRIYGKSRFLFAFYDLDVKEIRLFNASRNQAKVLFQTITEYKEDLGNVMFKFSRSGNKTETTYTLAPQLRIKDEKHKVAFDEAVMTVGQEIFEKALIVRSYEGQIKQLKELGFPTENVFGQAEPTKTEDPSFEEIPSASDNF